MPDAKLTARDYEFKGLSAGAAAHAGWLIMPDSQPPAAGQSTDSAAAAAKFLHFSPGVALYAESMEVPGQPPKPAGPSPAEQRQALRGTLDQLHARRADLLSREDESHRFNRSSPHLRAERLQVEKAIEDANTAIRSLPDHE